MAGRTWHAFAFESCDLEIFGICSGNACNSSEWRAEVYTDIYRYILEHSHPDVNSAWRHVSDSKQTAKTGRRGKLFKLPADLLIELDAFCEAHYGAPQVNIVKEALVEFIKRQLEAEPELRKRFAEARSRLNPRAGQIKLLETNRAVSSETE